MRETWVWSLGWEDPLEKGKATHSSILAWRVPWTGVAKSPTRLSDFHLHSGSLNFHGSSDAKESACNAGDLGSIPWLEISPREGKGYPLQYSGLDNSIYCVVHGATKSWHDWVSFTFTFKTPIKWSMVFSVVMYACESWTIKKAEHQRIDAFELWCWRRLVRVPWSARRSNQSILKEISPEYSWKDWY